MKFRLPLNTLLRLALIGLASTIASSLRGQALPAMALPVRQQAFANSAAGFLSGNLDDAEAKLATAIRGVAGTARWHALSGHELAHVLMHDPAGFVDGQTSGCRGDAEVEAESVAYLVASVHGIDADDYTFPYVAGWIGSNNPSTVLEATGKRVLATAHDILEQVETSMATALGNNDTIEHPGLGSTEAGDEA